MRKKTRRRTAHGSLGALVAALSRVPPVPLSHREERGFTGTEGQGSGIARRLALGGAVVVMPDVMAPTVEESREVYPVSPCTTRRGSP